MSELRAYLDNNATTRLAPEALAAMMPYLTDFFFNASSAASEWLQTGRPVTDAKRELAALFGDDLRAESFLLTSGASEANSWAVHAATWGRRPGHLVASAIEHPSLLAALEAQARAGWTVDLVKPMSSGRIDPHAFAERLRSDTKFAAIMLANNETGVIQPVAEIGAALRRIAPGALYHVDATQAPGRIAVSLDDTLADADFVSISAHKFHGPKGVGALFVAEGLIPALIHGSQEAEQRGGTLNTAGAAGMAVAARLARSRLAEMGRVRDLRDKFEDGLRSRIAEVRILGAEAERLPNTSAFCLTGVDAAHAVDVLARGGFAVASGAACASGATAPSHVFTAMGLDYHSAKETLRLSLSHDTTEADIDAVLGRICDLARVRA